KRWGRHGSNLRPTDYESVRVRFRDLWISSETGADQGKDIAVVFRLLPGLYGLPRPGRGLVITSTRTATSSSPMTDGRGTRPWAAGAPEGLPRRSLPPGDALLLRQPRPTRPPGSSSRGRGRRSRVGSTTRHHRGLPPPPW